MAADDRPRLRRRGAPAPSDQLAAVFAVASSPSVQV